MNLSDRKKEILCAVIEQYVETAEPVGSKAVAAGLSYPLSAATIRNEMAELESIGLLEQPHTSAGRIPSPLGYRLYVNELMRRHKLSKDDTREINSTLSNNPAGQHRKDRQGQGLLLDEAGKLTSRLTTYPAYAMAAASGCVCIARFDLIYVDSFTFIIVALLNNDDVKNKLVHLTTPIAQNTLTKAAAVFNASFSGITEERITPALISSTERALNDTAGLTAVISAFTIELLCEAKSGQTHVTGTMSILNHPEYKDIDKAQRIIRYLSDDKELAKLPSPESAGDLKITIGPENLAEELRDSSVVAIRYDAGGDTQGLIGVVGPTRMDYSKVAARLAYIARGLSMLLSGGELPHFGAEPSNSRTGDDELEQNE